MKWIICFLMLCSTLLSIWAEESQVDNKSVNTTPKIAFITAIYGNYESSCKKFAEQTIPADFICFTNLTSLRENGWIIDNNPYHITHPCPFDNGTLINSIANNSHNFNIAKYYKQNFNNIPRLKKYDVVVWLDGTIEVYNPIVAEWLVNKIKAYPIIGWEHEHRSGSLADETRASNMYRYTSTFWNGQHQPYQNVNAQYTTYLNEGYDEPGYWLSIDPTRRHLGVWVTCFVAFDNKNNDVINFLNLWYQQTLQYTTQDQIGFPYTVQKLNLLPYTLPDNEVSARGHEQTDFYIKHLHGY